jgi:hypothetical protein
VLKFVMYTLCLSNKILTAFGREDMSFHIMLAFVRTVRQQTLTRAEGCMIF